MSPSILICNALFSVQACIKIGTPSKGHRFYESPPGLRNLAKPELVSVMWVCINCLLTILALNISLPQWTICINGNYALNPFKLVINI